MEELGAMSLSSVESAELGATQLVLTCLIKCLQNYRAKLAYMVREAAESWALEALEDEYGVH